MFQMKQKLSMKKSDQFNLDLCILAGLALQNCKKKKVRSEKLSLTFHYGEPRG